MLARPRYNLVVDEDFKKPNKQKAYLLSTERSNIKHNKSILYKTVKITLSVSNCFISTINKIPVACYLCYKNILPWIYIIRHPNCISEEQMKTDLKAKQKKNDDQKITCIR